MADDTTTSTAVDDQAPVEEQLDTTDNGEAVETDDTSQTSESEEPEAQAEDNSDDFKDWAAKKNLPLDDPEKLGRMYRELETKLGSGDRNKLSESVGTANEAAGVDDVQGLKNQVAALSFYVTNPDAAKYDKEMGAILEARPYMANDLDGLLLMAKGQATTSDEQLLAARQAGSKEALATAANAQRAAAPKASATNRSTPGKLTDADISNMSLSEYQKAKADGLIDPFGDRP